MGEDLSALIRNPEAGLGREYVYATYFQGNHCLFNKEWKYIRYSNGDQELYDLYHDPEERNNLASDSGREDQIRILDAELNRQLASGEARARPVTEAS